MTKEVGVPLRSRRSATQLGVRFFFGGGVWAKMEGGMGKKDYEFFFANKIHFFANFGFGVLFSPSGISFSPTYLYVTPLHSAHPTYPPPPPSPLRKKNPGKPARPAPAQPRPSPSPPPSHDAPVVPTWLPAMVPRPQRQPLVDIRGAKAMRATFSPSGVSISPSGVSFLPSWVSFSPSGVSFSPHPSM